MRELPPLDRRRFLASSVATAAALAAGSTATALPKRAPSIRRVSPNGKVRVMAFGVGGMGGTDIPQIASHPMVEIAGLCDVSAEAIDVAKQKFPNAKTFSDYREALAAMGGTIDAVSVSTPDHHHAPIALGAMNLGKACYCQKPLTRTIAETRAMRAMARQKKLVTQMGIQRQASAGRQQGVALLKSGVLGKVVALHIWCDRPAGWWEQGHSRDRKSVV